MKKTISLISVILSITMLLASCGGEDGKTKKDETSAPTPNPELVKNTINATIELEGGDEIQLELYPDLAPDTVENFVELAEDGFYDGTIFHRVIEDFMIQGGGYDETLKQKKTESIKGEFEANGFENSLSHTRGVISMARTQDMDSASSQFFIVQQDSLYLDGQYAAFGKVTEGMDVVDDIASVKTGTVAASGMEDVPVEPIIIDSITIDSGNSSSKKKNSSKKDDSKDDDASSADRQSESDKEDDEISEDEDKASDKSNSADTASGEDEDDASDLTKDDIEAIFGASGLS